MIRGEIVKLTNRMDALFPKMNNADLTEEDIRMLLGLLWDGSVRLYQRVDARLKGPPRQALGSKMNTWTHIHGNSSSNTCFRRSTTIKNTAFLGSLPFQNMLLKAILLFPMEAAWRALHSFLLLHPVLGLYLNIHRYLAVSRSLFSGCWEFGDNPNPVYQSFEYLFILVS